MFNFKVINQADTARYPLLTLAYIGDAVFELYVRNLIVTNENVPVNILHNEVTGYVNASAQAQIIQKIMPLLSDDELILFKRGRNTKTGTVPKNSSVADYHYATGFEALLGFLYLNGNMQRLEELLKAATVHTK